MRGGCLGLGGGGIKGEAAGRCVRAQRCVEIRAGGGSDVGGVGLVDWALVHWLDDSDRVYASVSNVKRFRTSLHAWIGSGRNDAVMFSDVVHVEEWRWF